MKLFKNKSESGSKISGVIEKFFGGIMHDPEEIKNFKPAVNISADKSNFDISLLVPGLDKGVLTVEVNGNNPIIKCEKEFTQEKKESDYFRKEYTHPSFQRIFEIPKGADTSRIKAKLRNGILKINMPRLKEFIKDSNVIEVM